MEPTRNVVECMLCMVFMIFPDSVSCISTLMEWKQFLSEYLESCCQPEYTSIGVDGLMILLSSEVQTISIQCLGRGEWHQ